MKAFSLCIVACLLALFFPLRADAPPWRILYGNDTTNILNCDSPFNRPENRGVFTEEKLRESVREACVEGVDAQLLQPGTAWVPWWKSSLVPLEEHEAWFKSHYGFDKIARPEHDFLRNGGDMVAAFIDECHANGRAALVSFRANDSHLQEFAFDRENVKNGMAHCISRFYVEHPEYRRAPVGKNHWSQRNHNWAIPEARKYKEDLLAELIRNYPELDGVEIDFQRHPYYFPDDMPMNARVDIMVDFLKKARAVLDEIGAKDGRRRYLGVRVPTWPENCRDGVWKDVGFDPKAWHGAGVDFFNLSTHYCTSQNTGVALARKLAPQARIYEEITHTPMTWRMGGEGYDDHQYRRTTREAMESTARIAYARGADGVSLFNFAYYRPHGGFRKYKAPFNEPPFHCLPALADKAALEERPAYFFEWARDFFFPKGKKNAKEISMDIVPARGNGAAVLRLLVVTAAERGQSELEPLSPVARGRWAVELNGKPLSAVKNIWSAYPFETEVKSGFNKPEQYLAFAVPAGALKDGINTVRVANVSLPQDMCLRWVEIFQEPK